MFIWTGFLLESRIKSYYKLTVCVMKTWFIGYFTKCKFFSFRFWFFRLKVKLKICYEENVLSESSWEQKLDVVSRFSSWRKPSFIWNFALQLSSIVNNTLLVKKVVSHLKSYNLNEMNENSLLFKNDVSKYKMFQRENDVVLPGKGLVDGRYYFPMADRLEMIGILGYVLEKS